MFGLKMDVQVMNDVGQVRTTMSSNIGGKLGAAFDYGLPTAQVLSLAEQPQAYASSSYLEIWERNESKSRLAIPFFLPDEIP